MARPLKHTVDYFPHFVNSGKTLLILQNEFGNDGYAFWFKLLSLLCKTDGLVYDYNNSASWRLLLAETFVTEDIANKILQLLADIEAIDRELYLKKIIWVQNLVDNLGDVFTRRRNGSTPSKPVIVNKNTQTRLDQNKQDQRRPEKKATSPEIREIEFNAYIEELRPQYADLNFDNELKKFKLYWSEGSRKLQRPKLALTNWMDKARAFLKEDDKNGTYRGEPTKTSLKDSVGKPLGAGPTDWGVGKPLGGTGQTDWGVGKPLS